VKETRGRNLRVGVYVCHCGGNISEVVDVKKVAKAAGEEADVVIARDYEHMCSDLGQKLIVDDVKEHKLDRVVIAACSPQFQGGTFMTTLKTAGLSPYVLEMANIREQCAWPHADAPSEATEKATGLTRMSIAKARHDEPLEQRTMPIGKRVLVVGGGIAGIQAALDLGDAGFEVHLVERDPSIGGRMAQLSRTFPTEDCAACILSPKMADVPANPNIEMLTYSEVESVEGSLGSFEVTVVQKPRYVDPATCVACGLCEEKCPVSVPDEFEEGLTKRKAIYVPFGFSVPNKNLIDESVCLRLTRGGDVCGLCAGVCPHGAIDFDQKPERVTFTVDTIIVATGYQIFNAKEKAVYGYGRFKNVITALQMERMIVHAAEGNPVRPIKGRVAFIQCVGSRDEQVGNEYCSRVCCMYASKLSQLLKRSDPSRDIYVFYTDLRAFGKGFEEYYKRAQSEGVKYVRGRVAELFENPETKRVIIKAEDTLTRRIIESEFDLVVLSVGLCPSEGTARIAEILKLAKSPDGFLQEAHPKFRPVDTLTEGVFLAGAVQGPKDIPDTVAQASAASSRAIRLMNKGEHALDPIVAFVHEDLCDGCGFCAGVCPTDAISQTTGPPKISEALCTGCGICLSACPRDALDLHCYTNDQLLAQVEAAVGEARNGHGTIILVFADDAATYRLADNVGTGKMPYTTNARIIRVPSGSRVTPKLMLKAFELGVDGILIGESEEKSSPFAGSARAIRENVAKTRAILEAAGVDPERVRFLEFVTVMLGKFVGELNGLSEYAKRLGPIPEDKRQLLGEGVDSKLFAVQR
jgi:heterodisulfide reductase subunit A